MKATSILDLPIIPENYELEHYALIDYSCLHSEMMDSERRFINGLIRWYRPERILEIGVARGGSTVNILNAIGDFASKLVSIDILEKWWADESQLVGSDVALSGVGTEHWELITGADPSEVLDDLNTTFDFCVIDTAHMHPIESLNFLCALPFLNDGAIVVVHDTTDYLYYAADRHFANRILMMAVCAEKLEPMSPSPTGYPNIVALQVSQDTRRHIRNLFDTLMLPWEEVFVDTENIGALIRRHYSNEMTSYFKQAVEMQKRLPFIRHIGGHLLTIEPDLVFFDDWSSLGEGVIFYGAGQNMKWLLENGKELGWCFRYPIWDIGAEQVSEICGYPVSLPDFETTAEPGTRIVVTIGDEHVFKKVRGQLSQLGYRVFHGVGKIAEEIRCPHPKKDFSDWGGSLEMEFPVELCEEAKKLIRYVEENELTLCSRARTCATIQACQYVVENNIEGDFVECGVWRGGQSLLAAAVFKQMDSAKKVWLYDTFEGFTDVERSSIDYVVDVRDIEVHNEHFNRTFHSPAAVSGLGDVKSNFEKAGLLGENVVFVKGDVANTLEGDLIPEKVAVLRLDTDFYASTLKELQTLYPRLQHGGVLIVDDYGYCEGARAAVEEYFTNINRPMFHVIDEFGRLAIKIC